MRCGIDLFSEEDLLTGLCPDCWTVEDGDVDITPLGAERSEAPQEE